MAVACVPGVWAQMSVVRVDGNKVYFDISEAKTAPVKGSTFKVIVSSEPLTNPQTGKKLGEIYHYSSVGTITEVQPLYAVGELKQAEGITVGKQAVWEDVTPKTAVVAVAPAGAQTPVNVRKKTVYQPVEQTIISITEADVTAPGARNLVTLSEDNKLTVFARGEKDTLTPVLSYTLPTGKKGLSVSAAPVKEGKAQVFVSVFTPTRGTITTLVLEDKNGQLEQVSSLPFFAKELGCGADKKIWAQRPFVLGTAPGNAREVVYEHAKFSTGEQTFNTRHNWLAGLNFYPVENENQPNLITTASNGSLRVLLKNGRTAESKDLFGSTPSRLLYKQEILKFYPAIQVFGKPGQVQFAAVENDTKLGLLSETFGQYKAGKLHFLSYEKGSLNVTDSVELDGVVYDTACTEQAIIAAEVLPDGTSRVVEILK